MYQVVISLFETKCHDNTMHSTPPFHRIRYDQDGIMLLACLNFKWGEILNMIVASNKSF